jgi:RNA-directed DNA polymerase
MEDMTRWTPTSGSPQGAVISPLLANLYLHELDVEMRQAGLVMVRYADDAVVLCRTREEAEAALSRMRAWVDANGLNLHPDKTHIGLCHERVCILNTMLYSRWRKTLRGRFAGTDFKQP